MSTIPSTLPGPLKDLLKDTEKLHCRLDAEDRMSVRYVDHRELEYMLRQDLSKRLASHIVRGADYRSFSEDFGHARYMEASVYAFNTAELAVLLTRAYEAGRAGR